MYFRDLTPYEYGREDPRPDVLNIGWLSREHAFEWGEAESEFVLALRRLVASPVNLYRGMHLCEFCPEPPVVLSARGHRTIDPPPDITGNGEVRVPGRGVTYVAPVLIAHYVEVHSYVPPREFVDAVLVHAPSVA